MRNKRTFNMDGVILTKESIVNIIDIFEKYDENVYIDIVLNNNETYEKMTKDEFNKKNFNNFMIENINIYSGNAQLWTFFSDEYSIKIESDNDKVNNFQKEIDDWILNNSSMFRKKIARFNKSLISFTLFTIIMMIITFVGFYNISQKLSLNENYIFVSVGIIDSYLGYGIRNLFLKLFPLTEISFGFNKSAKIRSFIWQFFVLIVLPVSISVILGLIK